MSYRKAHREKVGMETFSFKKTGMEHPSTIFIIPLIPLKKNHGSGEDLAFFFSYDHIS